MRYDFDKTNSYKLLIADLRIWLHLGCSQEERFTPQLVSFNINLTFNSPPIATITNKLEDTVCYAGIVENIQALCQTKQFNLIEYLAAVIYKTIDQSLGDKKNNITLISVKISKMSPPIPGVHGWVTFSYCQAPIHEAVT